MLKRSKKRAKKSPRRADKRTRQVLNGTVFRIRAACGSEERIEPLFPDQLAEAALSGERAARRWITDKKLPRLVQALLEHRVLGLIHDPAFDGWHVRDGSLVTPKGVDITPGMIEGLTLIRQRNRWQSLRIAEQDAKINRLEEAVEFWRGRAGQQRAANDPN